MNCDECQAKLQELLDDSPGDRHGAGDAEMHAAGCEHCHAWLARTRQIQAGAKSLVNDRAPPHDLWPVIAAALGTASTPGTIPTPDPVTNPHAQHASDGQIKFPSYLAPRGLAIAAAIALLFAIAASVRWLTPRDRPAWEVASVAGTPRIGRQTFTGPGRLGVGQWLETDQVSQARLTVGSIGEVNIEPNSRLRLVEASTNDHRVELQRGTLHALIWAPPRLFFVETPSATAIDLGCAYTLTVDEHGGSMLTVESGYVALEHGRREAIIPAGLRCATRKGVGPGTPFAAQATAALQGALERFDFGNDPSAALPLVLAAAGDQDGVTLWHLLGRTTGIERGNVFDALARLQAPPPGVTRSGILAGDRAMQAKWADALGLASSLMR